MTHKLLSKESEEKDEKKGSHQLKCFKHIVNTVPVASKRNY